MHPRIQELKIICKKNKVPFETHENWIFEEKETIFQICVINNNTIYSLWDGYSYTDINKKSIALNNEIVKNILQQSKKVNQVFDYHLLTGSSLVCRQDFLAWIRAGIKNVDKIILLGLKALLKLAARAVISVTKKSNDTYFVDTLDQVMLKISIVNSSKYFAYNNIKRKFLEINNLRISFQDPLFSLETYKIDQNIYYREYKGSAIYRSEYSKVEKQFINEIIEHEEVFIVENLSGLKKIDWKSKQKAFVWYKGIINSINTVVFIKPDNAIIASSKIYKSLFNRRINIVFCETKDEALKYVFDNKYKYHRQKKELTLKDIRLSQLTRKLSGLTWNESIKTEEFDIPEDDEFYPIFKSINIIQDDILEMKKELERFNLDLQNRVDEQTKELIKANESLIKAKRKAEESDRLKSAFLANMSHEIRTPLNSMLGFAELMRDSDEPVKDYKKYLDIIVKSGHNLLNIINDIIDISKIESNLLKIVKRPTDVNSLINDVFNLHSSSIKAKNNNIELILNNKIEENLVINTDGQRVNQILNNLMSNALKFTSKGTVTLETFQTQNTINFRVIDTGIGIAPENTKNVFKRFIQEDGTIEREFGGSGLGLSISKSLSSMLGGGITVESQKGKGSIFTLSLPCSCSNQLEQSNLLEEKDTSLNFNNNSILIVEDGEDNILYLKEILKTQNLQLYFARDGQEAIDVFYEHSDKIELILLDINLPKLSGITVAAKIKETHNRIPIVAQTANVMTDEEIKYLEGDFDAYLAKPIQAKNLLNTLKQFLGD